MEIVIKKLIENALIEDIQWGDITSLNIISKNKKGIGEFLVKENGIIGGLEIVQYVFELLSNEIKLNFNISDGCFVEKDTVIGTIEGPLLYILQGERLALNFLQRISGVATLTKKYVDIVKKNEKNIKIADTRKTTPNFRYFEKLGVQIGGGINHRMGLFDAVMIKDNHIIAAGGIKSALKNIYKKIGHTIKVEIEIKRLEQLEEILSCKYQPDIIMFDNFTPQMIQKGIKILKNKKFIIEVSGNISLNNLEKYLIDGVNIISVGKLTHSYTALDISLNLKI